MKRYCGDTGSNRSVLTGFNSVSLWERQENVHVISGAVEATRANERGAPDILGSVKGVSAMGRSGSTWFSQYVLQCSEVSGVVCCGTD